MTGQKEATNFKFILSAAFLLYIIITGYTILHHEPWGDEIHSWNIAKASSTLTDLITNTRYEGHPPLWYIILWTISKFSTNPFYFQLVHLIIASASVYILIFHSPLPLAIRLVIPFGYFFIFEYSVISRNYAIAILLAFCICVVLYKNFKGKLIIYYGLLFLLSNTHLLGLLLAGSIHLYFLLIIQEKEKSIRPILQHVIIALVILLPAACFIFPPSDSELNVDFWKDKWSTDNLKTFAQAPLRAYLPIPAWWVYNNWNSHFLMENQHDNNLLKYFNLIVSASLAAVSFYFIKSSKKCLVLFGTNFFLTFIVAVMVFPLTRERYAGFLFISLVVALWLFYTEQKERKESWLLILFFFLQIPGGIIMILKDIQLPFSNAYRVNDLLKKIPTQQKVVSDYWAVNAVNAFSDQQLFCLDMGKEVKFILWGQDLSKMLQKKDRYTSGAKYFLQKENLSSFYLLSIGTPQNITEADKDFFNVYNVKMIDKIEGAINKGGNLYLYEVRSK